MVREQESEIKLTKDREDYLLQAISDLQPTGSTGFEGLIRELLECWTGHIFRLARSGSQSGKDATSDSPSGIFFAAEMKQYKKGGTISRRELLGEISEVVQALPNLDLWVLATTTEIGDREAESIKKHSELLGIESLILDLRADDSGYLKIFCAKYPDTTKEFCLRYCKNIKMEELDFSISSIQNNVNYEASVKQLHEIMDATLFGFNDTRRRAFQWLSKHINNQIESMAVFLQDIGLHDNNRRQPIIRTNLNAQLNSWWEKINIDSSHAILLGEEGTGKTWASMAWLSTKFDAETGPILLPVTSVQLSNTIDLYELIIEILIKRCGKTEIFWKRRLSGWLANSATDRPLFLLYLDGLNEKPNLPWRNLITQSNSYDWHGLIAIFMSSRKEFYQTKIASQGLGIKTIETTGYDDQELKLELNRAGIVSLNVIPAELHSLIRKPRYCDLALRYFSRLLESGDLTVERLLYQDYKEREAKKHNQPVSDEDFNQVLCGLARKYIDGIKSFGKKDLMTMIPGSDESGAILQEIIDGGLLVKTNQTEAPYIVESRRLIYGLGMLLADHASNKPNLSINEYSEAIETWLEPHPDMELKISIVGAAVFISIINNDFPVNSKRALLRTWLGMRNMTERQEKAVNAYLPDCIQDVIEIADIFWSNQQDNGIAQERLAKIFIKYRDDSKIKSTLVDACKRWMSYININGHPFERQSNEKKSSKLRTDLFNRLGRKVMPESTINFHNRQFFIIEDDNMIRLARFAIFIISAGDRLSFMEAFFQWAVSRQLMGTHLEFDEVAWTLRLTDEDVWSAFEPTLTQMALSNNETLRKAARLLLVCIGNREANILIEKHLSSLYPATEYQIEYKKDPYASIFALPSGEDCEPCMARDDLKLVHIVHKIDKYLTDPDITAPINFVSRLREGIQALPVERYLASYQGTVEDHQFETFIPVLARFAFQNLGELMRKVVNSLDNRNEEGKRQLLIHLPKLGIVLNEQELSILDKALKIYHGKASIWQTRADDKPIDREMLAESYGTLVRIMHLNADDIATFILNRPDKALDLDSFGHWFQALSGNAVSDYLSRLLTEQSPVSQYRILWLLHNSELILSDAHRHMLIEWMDGTNHALRYSALQFVWLSGDKHLINHILQKDVRVLDPETNRCDTWIANIYCKYGRDLSLDKIIKLLPLEWVSEVVFEKSCNSDDVHIFANCLDTVWQSIAQCNKTDNNASVAMQVEKYKNNGSTFVKYKEPSYDNSIRYISIFFSWRSSNPKEGNAIPDFPSEESFEDFVKRQYIFHEQIKVLMQKEQTRWRYCQFNNDVMACLCREHPKIIEKWLNAVFDTTSKVHLLLICSGFYQSLCSALVKTGDSRGFILWKKIREYPDRVNFISNHAGTDLMTCLPFTAMPSLDANKAALELFNNCCTDTGLLELANAASAYEQQTWIWERCRHLVSLKPLWLRAKGLMFFSLADMESGIDSLMNFADIGGTWVEKLLPTMEYLHKRNRSARHWYNRFLTVLDNDEAFASFLLFLKSTDRRCYLWMDTLDERALKDNIIAEKRVKFRIINIDEIKNAIKENEKELDNSFLTLKFEKGQILPFL